MQKFKRSILVMGVLLAGPVSAHSGGLNKDGCHTNRKTGDYHCHRPQSASPTYTPSPHRGSLAPAAAESAEPASRSVPAGRAFANCSEARAAGAAPVRRGDPGYGPHLDRDNDGVGCEPYRGR